MILLLYLLIIASGLIFLVLGLKYGFYGTGVVVQDDSGYDYHSKPIHTLVVLGLAALMFTTAALNSFDITTLHCENVVNTTLVNGNTTTYTNDIQCEDYSYSEPVNSYLFYGLTALTILMLLIFGVKSYIVK